MKCAKAKKWISADIDNGLSAAQKSTLDSHLQTCQKCRKLRDDFLKIAATARELEEFSPRGESWFKIASQIQTNKGGSVRRVRPGTQRLFSSPRVLAWTAAAALFLVVVSGTLFFGPRIWKLDPGSQKYVLSKLEKAERHYQKAIESLWLAVSSQRDDIDPQLYAVFQKTLDIIDQSIVACKEAVLSSPDSIDSRNFLLAAYKQKRNLLEEMMGASVSPVEQRDVGSIY